MKQEEMKTGDVQQIMILLTDGMSNNKDALEEAVQSAKANLKGNPCCLLCF
jgi:Mg-chelatase subunit ChlD